MIHAEYPSNLEPYGPELKFPELWELMKRGEVVERHGDFVRYSARFERWSTSIRAWTLAVLSGEGVGRATRPKPKPRRQVTRDEAAVAMIGGVKAWNVDGTGWWWNSASGSFWWDDGDNYHREITLPGGYWFLDPPEQASPEPATPSPIGTLINDRFRVTEGPISAEEADRRAKAGELVAALRAMAERANTARGASWEHGARSATILTEAADSILASADRRGPRSVAVGD